MQIRSATTISVLLILVALACWSWIIAMARDMYGPMTGASAWMMTPHWDAPHLLLLWAMWAVMMTGMMLPSATPLILLARPGGHAHVLALGYVVIWALFSVAATGLQWLLTRMMIINPMMELAAPSAGAVLLCAAGVYQWSPLKHACLSACQSPMDFLARRWRSGASGAFRMGVEHGIYCVGCCWVLMLLLFVGGVMNLTVIVALTLFVAFEKLVPARLQTARLSGVVLIGVALWMVVR